jgi:ankyrin repeat protein
MATGLPPRPHLEHLRRQARELQRALNAGDATAMARAAPYRVGTGATLAQAQLVLARECGQPSWPALTRAVAEARSVQADDAAADDAFAAAWLKLALGHGYERPRPALAWAQLHSRSRPGGEAGLAVALASGDLVAVQGALPAARVNRPIGPLRAAPLVHVAFSGLARLPAAQPGLLAVLRWLLQAGADPDTRWASAGSPEPLPVLYGATAHAGSAAFVQALLDAGAEPNDNESLYHATEQADRGIVAALVAAGARWAGTNALFRQLDHDDLPGLQQALALGADPNELSPSIGQRPLQHAVLRGRALPFLQALHAAGADPAATDRLGLALAPYALRTGRRDVLEWLQALGVPGVAALSPAEQLVAACAAADGDAARAVLAAHPGLLQRLDRHALALLPEQAQRGERASVRVMLELGWPVAVKGPWEASALNQAAFRGDAAMVALLLRHGARWHETNGYGGDALGSCLHAGVNEPVPGGDYAEVLRLLLADGAPRPEPTAAWPEPMRAVLAAG